MEIIVISGFIFQAFKFGSSSKHIGKDTSTPHRLYKNTTIISAGYCFITVVCLQGTKFYVSNLHEKSKIHNVLQIIV
jgi:hypothetical protein